MKKNQGFSLVELIVVIAIMAILVGVLAPAYLRYVEKSRKSTDISAVSEMMGAAEKVAGDPLYDDIKATDTFNISASGGYVTITYSGTDAKAQAAVQDMANVGTTGYKLKSKAYINGSGTITGTVGTNGEISWAGGSTGLFVKGSTDEDTFTGYSKDFDSKLK